MIPGYIIIRPLMHTLNVHFYKEILNFGTDAISEPSLDLARLHDTIPVFVMKKLAESNNYT